MESAQEIRSTVKEKCNRIVLTILEGEIVSQQEQPFDADTIEANTELLTDLYLQSGIDIPLIDDSWAAPTQVLDTAIATLAKHGKHKTLAEIVEAEELDSVNRNYDYELVVTMSAIHALWIDVDYFVSRSDNLLNIEIASKELNEAGRKDRFNRSVAAIVVAHGRLMRFDESFYGWTDWDGKKEKIVAAFDLKTDYWTEFNGTFATEEDSRSGFTLNVLYEDGSFRKLRYEAEIGEIMRELG
jgi:hypothetical protein